MKLVYYDANDPHDGGEDYPMVWRLDDLIRLYNAVVTVGCTVSAERWGRGTRAQQGNQLTVAKEIRVDFPNGLTMLMPNARLERWDNGSDVAFVMVVELGRPEDS